MSSIIATAVIDIGEGIALMSLTSTAIGRQDVGEIYVATFKYNATFYYFSFD
ncbi:hypothetical protein [Listeria innocua]|uniref:hypothetical protein n=1 Tax=Listeria innocua TaxID=1642 RepID=UPI0021AB3447|nr:hypothetical protein [Listeria innocua]